MHSDATAFSDTQNKCTTRPHPPHRLHLLSPPAAPMQDSSRLASLLDTAEEEEAEPGGTDCAGPAPRRGRPEGGGGTGNAVSVFADARKSLGLAGAPLPGSVSPHLFLGKKSNSRSK